jgi:hypothetical protein
MTPPATTARRSTAPSFPRRVSGPIGGRDTAWVGPRPAGQRERTSSGSSLRTKVQTGSAAATGLAVRALSFVRALPDHPLLDRVVRGRAWIPLLGALLAGIVAMQVEVLKLGASIGRSIERSSALESRNQLLRASVAQLSGEQRIERVAAAMGMIMPPPGAVGFLSAGQAGSVQRAIANVRAPDPSAFALTPSANGAVVTGPDQTAGTSSSAGPSSATGEASAAEGASATGGVATAGSATGEGSSTATATTADAASATPAAGTGGGVSATPTASPAGGASATATAAPGPTGPSPQDNLPGQASPASQPGSTSGAVSAPAGG